ncbi:NCS1 family nucleobase:cation symporter-1 [Kineococcus radiotolerans]|uniref:NCS1 family nucleobase:cation symporter-1 n=1 Tax=Kineococcus radiotolerans TaxID=131568 RepID=A0A7W4XY77_KINRA|nr:cytosine permease [Kineococcus radiotolerans]MBB2901965.1 NCS1 family nucleobase:cation symporter-1 [Kineococcus radiotolerans]
MSEIPVVPEAKVGGVGVELNGVNAVAAAERHGRPRDLFWPWFAANVSVLAVSYGSFVLGFGISFWQATFVSVGGVLLSYVLVGLVAIAGKRGSAPTMTLSRAAFGVDGNRLPSLVSWLLTLGWETSLAAVAVLATATVLDRLGAGGGTGTKLVALVVVVGLIVLGGTLGFRVIMRMQRWITVVTAVLTVLYIVFAAGSIDLDAVTAIPAGSTAAVVGAFTMVMTGFGLGWANAAADYSRYLPRDASSRGVVLWTTLGCSIGPAVLLVFGALLVGSSPDLGARVAQDPVGALTGILPTWFLVPFVVVAVLGLVGGAVMDIYSSGLALLNVGLRVPRPVAVLVDGALMVAGAVYIAFFSQDFLVPFQGFLITLGVPIAAWAGIFLADLAMRRGDYAEDELLDPRGRYGSVRPLAVGTMLVATFLGWGLVTNSGAGWLTWQGYLLGPIGGREGTWAYANLGVLLAFAIGFVVVALLGRSAVRRQEARA